MAMKQSKIFKLKFFIYQPLIYFSFLLIPVWIAKLEGSSKAVQITMILLYILFIVGQWFLLGKEIDYRFKIYFRANSSIDRIVYRIFLGKLAMLLYFVGLSFIPNAMLKHFFWGTWVALGLFYSWPARGKIIQETMSSNFMEFRFLDHLEKTIVIACALLVLISIPKFPSLLNYEALKLVIDPHEKFHHLFWNFMHVNYFPFYRYPQLYKIAWSMHFYCIGIGTLCLGFYALLRYFFSRRVSILGVFALLSSWSFPKLLASNIHWTITSTFLAFWLWAILWASKSQTYRCGLFLGLLSFWGVLINPSYFFLIPAQIALLYFIFLRNQTSWFKNQMLKYLSLGVILSIICFISNREALQGINTTSAAELLSQVLKAIDVKAFFILAIGGVILIGCKILERCFGKEFPLTKNWRINAVNLQTFIIAFSTALLLSFFIDHLLFYGFSILWPLCWLSLVPVEWIFQSLSKLRSTRNLIYGIYILICLLDSHLEGRIKILINALSQES